MNFNDLKVMLVDDHEQMLKLLGSMLRSFGDCRITVFTSAVEALLNLSLVKPDIIITDWRMQPLDGLEFVKHLRENPASPYHDVPIIMLTGRTEEDEVLEAGRAGVNAFLAKPVTTQVLRERIEHLMLAEEVSEL